MVSRSRSTVWSRSLADGLNGLLGTIVQIKLNQVTLTPSGDGFVYRRRAVEVQVLPASGGAALIDAVAGEAQVNRSGGVCDVPNLPLQCPSGASFDAKSGKLRRPAGCPRHGQPERSMPARGQSDRERQLRRDRHGQRTRPGFWPGCRREC